eukprot:g17957.t1
MSLKTRQEECQRQLELRRNKLKAATRDVKALADKAVNSLQLIQHFEPFFARSSLEPHCEYLQNVSKASLLARLKFLGVKNPSGTKAELLSELLSKAEKCSSSARAKALGRFFDSKSSGRPSKDTEHTGQAETAWRQLSSMVEGAEENEGAVDCIGSAAVREAIRDAMAACGSSAPSRCLKMRQTLGMPLAPEEDRGRLRAQGSGKSKLRSFRVASRRMARISSLVLLVACALLGSRVSTLLFANAPTQSLRSRTTARAVDERDEGLVLIKPEESGKVVKRDKFNNPPRIVMKTNDWDQPEIQLSTGASNQINYITPVVQSDDIKAWLSLNVNFFAIIGLTTVGGLIEIQRFFPDTLYW